MPATPNSDPYYRLRHSAAHVLAEAVLELFPDGKIAIGPPIEDGFYYDFDLPRALTPDDLGEIEARMRAALDRMDPERLLETWMPAVKGWEDLMKAFVPRAEPAAKSRKA